MKAETIGAAQLPIIAEALMANGAPLAAISDAGNIPLITWVAAM